jgi:hypothetical protein
MNFCKLKIICIWEDNKTKLLSNKIHQAYFIGINGIITKMSI